MAHSLYSGRNHYAALRNPPTDWTLQTKAELLIREQPPEAPTGEQVTRNVVTPQQHDVGNSAGQGRDGGPEAEREKALRGSSASTKKVAWKTTGPLRRPAMVLARLSPDV